jgi:O-antigen/teichoic acid export membrane protein
MKNPGFFVLPIRFCRKNVCTRICQRVGTKKDCCCMNIVHFLLTVFQAVAAVISLLAGYIVVKNIRRKYSSWLFTTYLWALVATVVALVAVIAWNWLRLTVALQITYIILGLLSFYAVFRGFQAQHKQFHRYTGWRLEFIDDVGFTLVFLLVGFVMLGSIGLGWPAWAVVLVSIAGIAGGRMWVLHAKNRYLVERAKKEGW